MTNWRNILGYITEPEEIKVGDKVVPISKSVGDSWEMVATIKLMREKNQPFLYVTDIGYEYIRGRKYLVYSCYTEPANHGDFYLREDLKLYEE
jgi:hypothetical protein